MLLKSSKVLPYGIGIYTKPAVCSPLKLDQLVKCFLRWKYLKLDFQCILFTNKCRVSLDDPDNRWRGCCLKENPKLICLRHQQRGGGVMFWGEIIGNELVGPQNDFKMNFSVYVKFFRVNLQWYLMKKTLIFKWKVVFMYCSSSFYYCNHWVLH